MRDSAVILYVMEDQREEMATFLAHLIHIGDQFIDVPETIELFINLLNEWDGEVTVADIDHLYNVAATTKFLYGTDRWN